MAAGGRWSVGVSGTLGGMPDAVARREVSQRCSAQASRRWWDEEAADYYREHGELLGDRDLVWGPEGVREADLRLLGPLEGRRVLEVGCGAGQGARWCADQGAGSVAFDLSGAMLACGRALDADGAARPAAYVQGDAVRLPFDDEAFDVVFSAYGALPFVADSAEALVEMTRVLRAGGRAVCSVTHPVRWALPDLPGPAGLVVRHSYFDRSPYVEQDADGTVRYMEHHRTLGDRVREIRAAGLVLVDLVEPEWPPHADHVWGGWSRERGLLLPGTAIFCTRKPVRG